MRFLLVLLLALAPPSPIAEKYDCTGIIPSGSYRTSLSIQVKDKNFFLTWEQSNMVGMGFLSGNQLVVSFVNLPNREVGVALYQVKPGQLLGEWSGGEGKIYQERCLAGRPA